MVPGVRVRLYHELLRRFGEPAGVLAASVQKLEEAGVPARTAGAITLGRAREAAERDLDLAAQVGARLVTWGDPEYPSLLRSIYDPPPYLYVRGKIDARDEFAVAIVGSRAASAYGCGSATALGHDLALAGATIVSGLAHGIDGAAHRGALSAGGRTIAVLGCGIDVAYPREHAALAATIAESGALVSEFFMGTPPRAAHFPIRNRIISGLVRGVLVVEATERSGSLITARLALEQGREVFAVPGLITATRSRGANGLIRQGAAKLITAAADVLEELRVDSPMRARLGSVPENPSAAKRPSPTKEGCVEEDLIVGALDDGAADVDALVSQTGLTPQEVLRILLKMELSGIVEQIPGSGFGLQRDRVERCSQVW
jgi:DNA processing protein